MSRPFFMHLVQNTLDRFQNNANNFQYSVIFSAVLGLGSYISFKNGGVLTFNSDSFCGKQIFRTHKTK